MKDIKVLSVPEPSIVFMAGKNEAMKLETNGDIFVNGRLVENDREVIDGLRDFLRYHVDYRNRMEELEKALKFYADEGNYVRWEGSTSKTEIEKDSGHIARMALWVKLK